MSPSRGKTAFWWRKSRFYILPCSISDCRDKHPDSFPAPVSPRPWHPFSRKWNPPRFPPGFWASTTTPFPPREPHDCEIRPPTREHRRSPPSTTQTTWPEFWSRSCRVSLSPPLCSRFCVIPEPPPTTCCAKPENLSGSWRKSGRCMCEKRSWKLPKRSCGPGCCVAGLSPRAQSSSPSFW